MGFRGVGANLLAPGRTKEGESDESSNAVHFSCSERIGLMLILRRETQFIYEPDRRISGNSDSLKVACEGVAEHAGHREKDRNANNPVATGSFSVVWPWPLF